MQEIHSEINQSELSSNGLNGAEKREDSQLEKRFQTDIVRKSTEHHSCLSSPLKRRLAGGWGNGAGRLDSPLRVTFAEDHNEYVEPSRHRRPFSTYVIDSDGNEITVYDLDLDMLEIDDLSAESHDTTISTIKRSSSTESRDNPFLLDGELSRKADYIVSHSTILRSNLLITDPDTLPQSTIQEQLQQPLNPAAAEHPFLHSQHHNEEYNSYQTDHQTNLLEKPVSGENTENYNTETNEISLVRVNNLSQSCENTETEGANSSNKNSKENTDTDDVTRSCVSRVQVAKRDTCVYVITDSSRLTTVCVSYDNDDEEDDDDDDDDECDCDNNDKTDKSGCINGSIDGTGCTNSCEKLTARNGKESPRRKSRDSDKVRASPRISDSSRPDMPLLDKPKRLCCAMQ